MAKAPPFKKCPECGKPMFGGPKNHKCKGGKKGDKC